MGEVKNIVVNQLKDYRKNRQLIALLTFELAHPAKISNENVIDVLNHEGVASLALLMNYRKNQKHIALLKAEMESPAQISDEEMLEAMIFGRNDLGGASGRHISDKTPSIALKYRELTKQTNDESRRDIAVQLYLLTCQQERLEKYIDTMDEQDASLLRMTYMDGKKNGEIAKAFGCSPRTIASRRNRAIDALCELYVFTKQTGSLKPIV